MTVTRKFPRAKPYRRAVTEIKAVVRFRDGYRCTQCGITARQHVKKFKKTLDVHRLVPGSRYTVKGCVTLCRKCHGPQPRSPHGSSGRVKISGQLARKIKLICLVTGEDFNDYIVRVLAPVVRADFKEFVRLELLKHD